MRPSVFAPVALALLATTGCGHSIRTSADYDRAVDFSNYHTFFIIKGNPSGNPQLDQRAIEEVCRNLTSKGWAEVPEGEGRAAVVVHAATTTKRSHEMFYDGWGGWRWHWGRGGTPPTLVEDYRIGTVVVDIFDFDTKQAIWHGAAIDALSDSASANARVNGQAIARMFGTFPTPARAE